MLICIFTHQKMAQGAAEASSKQETAPEWLAMESCTSYRGPEDQLASAPAFRECISKRGLFGFLF